MGHRTALVLAFVLSLSAGCNEQTNSLPELRPFPPRDGAPLDASVAPSDPLLALGQALFFDPELSGNRDISCGTCHVPFLTTAEGLPLSIGHGATELGPFRTRGAAAIVARHTPDLFHRVDMDVLFWDGRVQRLLTGEVIGPVPTPVGITSALELASITPLLDRAEMRGAPGDLAIDGQLNELATIDDAEPEAIWGAIVGRLLRIPGYVDLFSRAFPDEHTPGIQHVAIALAHFQSVLWGPIEADEDVPRDPEVVRGEVLFGGDARCARCHSGLLFTDERFYNLAVPQLGPGFPDDLGGLDEGRARVTGDPVDRFAFRTPPLRNVALTPPYMHNGAYDTLEDAIRHHLDPVASLRAYTGEHLPESLRATLRNDPALLDQLEQNLADTAPRRPLADDEIAAIVAFLMSLSSPAELTRHPEDSLPASVPSGLTIDRWNGSPHPFR